MEELRPLSDIFIERDYLFGIYVKLIDCDSRDLRELRKDLDILLMFNIMFMPYWLVIELQELGFDISKNI